MRMRTGFVAVLTAVCMLGWLAACGTEEAPMRKRSEVVCSVQEEEFVRSYGRTYAYDGGTAYPNAASGFAVRFYGTKLEAELYAFGEWDAGLSVMVDGETDSNAAIFTLPRGGGYARTVLVRDIAEGEHTVCILKRHDSLRNTFACRTLTTDGTFLPAPESPSLKMEVYGDSITSGSGILRATDPAAHTDSGEYSQRTQNALQSYAAVAAARLGAELRIYGRGGIAMAYSTDRNTVLSNYDAAAVDLDRECFPYDYNSWTPDVVVIYLGTNDVLIAAQHDTGFTMEGLKAAYCSFLRGVIGQYYGKDIPVFLCSGMMVPDSGLGDCMEEVRAELCGEFPNLETIEFDACAIGHPVVSENQTAGEELAQAIGQKLGN